jgi:hypothetical protein
MTMADASVTILSPEKAASTYATKAAVATAARAVAPASGIAFLTDSIGAFSSATGQAWHRIASPLSMGRLLWRGYFGTGGFTLAQIRDTHLPQVLALPVLPGSVAICGGTNDVAAVNYSETASRATLLDIIGQLTAVGIRPVLWTLPPRDDSAAVNILVQRWNVWVRGLAGARNLPLIDAHTALVDPATGLYRAGYTADGIHPTIAGHFALGKAIGLDARFLEHFRTNSAYLSASKGADPSLIPANARFFDAGQNGAGSPTNWTGFAIGTAATGSVIAGDSAIRGSWFRFTKTAALPNGVALARQEVLPGASTFTPGDRVAFAIRFKVSAPEDGAGAVAHVFLSNRSDSAEIFGSYVYGAGGDNLEGIAYIELTTAATATRIRAEFGITGQAAADSWVQYAQPTLINLTKLGL